MKKILLLAALAAAVFTVGSCQKEIAYLDGDTKVTFEVSTGDIATKTIADGTNISVLHWELYGADIRTAQAPYGEDTVVDTDGDKKFTVELTLVADQDYNIVFWAETEDGQAHYVTDDLRSVKIKSYTDETANDESRAAFFATYAFHPQSGQSINETITLYRPFSQINLGATNYDTSLNLVNGGKIIVESTEMTVSKIADSFNTIDGVGETSASFNGTVTFAAAATPNGAADQTDKLLSVNGEPYYWVGMNYLIVEGNSDAVTVDVTLNTNMGVVSHSVGNVPVKENYRTNILGDFLTTGAKFNIVVDERFQQPDEVVNVAFTAAALQNLIDNAPVGTTLISVANDIVGDLTVAEKPGTVLIIDGAGHKYDGTIKIHANSSRNDGAVEIRNFCFETSTKSEEFIQALDFGNAMRYSQNITVRNCSFVGVLGSAAEKTAVGIKVNATQNFNAINCTAANLHSFMQAQSCDQNVTIDGITAENCKNGVSFGNTAYPTLKDATIVAAEYGIRADGDASRGNLVVDNSTITAKQPVIVRKVTTDGYAVALNAAVLNTSEAYHVVFTKGSDDAAYVAPEKAFSITGAGSYSVFPL